MDMFKIQKAYFGFYHKIKQYKIAKYVNSIAEKYTSPDFKLTKEQEEQVRSFYAPYIKNMPMLFHRFYTEKTGVFSPYYLPADIYLNYVDEYFNNRDESKFIDNKCYYPTIFAGISQPEAIAYRIGDIWYSADMNIIDYGKVGELVNAETEIFVKKATSSYGGKGIAYISSSKGEVYSQFEEFLTTAKVDVVVQKLIKQHKDISAINESSVNTMRIVSLLTNEGVKIYSSSLRIGVGNEKVDNISSGGIACGIRDDGKLKDCAYNMNGDKYAVHPTNGFVFDGYQLPGFEEAKALIKRAHPMVPHFKLVSWDIAIKEDGQPVMVEANLAKGSSKIPQFNNGPLFGDDTKKILDEVFGVNK